MTYIETCQKIDTCLTFSGYPKGHLLYDTTNKKVIGKMKDETASVLIKAFVGLRAKMYSLVHGDEEKRTAKGVSKAVIKTKLRKACSTENHRWNR
jgi:hypothetical protein